MCGERIRPGADHVGDHPHALIGVGQLGSESWVTSVLGGKFLIVVERRLQ